MFLRMEMTGADAFLHATSDEVFTATGGVAIVPAQFESLNRWVVLAIVTCVVNQEDLRSLNSFRRSHQPSSGLERSG